MADISPQVETQDNLGSTVHDNGTVGTSLAQIPTSNTKVIADLNIECMESNVDAARLLVSFDGGTNFKTLLPGDNLSWTFRGDAIEIDIKGNQAGVIYESIFNVELE